MKRYRYIWSLIIVLSSCTAGFEKINTDPKKADSIPPGDQLTAAAYFMDGGRNGLSEPVFVSATGTIPQWSTGYECRGKYILNEFYNNCMWENLYGKSLKQLVDLLERHKGDTTLVNYLAAARILRVYVFSLLTDAYGDIPYSQAGLAYYNKIYTPAYDKQSDIYIDFFKELKEATAQFDATKEGIENDIVYNGDLGKWKRLAGSLRLRLAMRLTKVNGIIAREQVQSALAAGVMRNVEDNFRMLHDDYAYPDLRGNSYAQALLEDKVYQWAKGCASFVDYLKKEQDPRLPFFFVNQDFDGKDITNITNYLAIAPGLYYWDDEEIYTSPEGIKVPAENKYCFLSQSFYHLASPFLHMGYAEVAFLQAEAAALGWIPDDANSWYQTGIAAAFEQMKLYPEIPYISEETRATFLKTHTLQAGKEIEQINMQKWVALFPNGYEAYANQRRSGYPILAPITDYGSESETGGIPPKRLFYPSTEAFSNTVHYQEALDRMGGTDNWLHPVWWDK